jgi:VanZ family protein
MRVAAWFCVAVIAVLSLIPHEMEVRTPWPGFVEHLLAYAGTAGLFGAGYRSWAVWRIAAALFFYAGLLEALQALVPGRHPELDGALVSGAGGFLGAFGGSLIRSAIAEGQSDSDARS